MKNLTKLFGGLLLAFGLLALAKPALATGLAIAPKEVWTSTSTTGLVQISPAISTSAATNAAFMPGAVYELNMSTGASAEAYILYDSTFTNGITCNSVSNPVASSIIGKYLFGSTTAGTQVRLDPPIVFHNGLVGCDTAATGIVSITYELGRGLSGQ